MSGNNAFAGAGSDSALNSATQSVVEALKARQFFSASLAGGVLSVYGTRGDDIIRVHYNADRTSIVAAVNGTSQL